MCGRVRLSSDYSEIRIKLRFDDDVPAPNFAPSWNLPPTQPILIARNDAGKRVPDMVRWGIVPPWEPEPKTKLNTFNARADTVATARAFRDPWKKGQRCLVVTNGFYEWHQPDKQPYAIGLVHDPIMVMAGLWDVWASTSGERVSGCTIITTEANAAMAPIHNRMPVLLGEDAWPAWLGEASASEDDLRSLLVPCPPEWLKIWMVDRRVNNARNNDAAIADPVRPETS